MDVKTAISFGIKQLSERFERDAAKVDSEFLLAKVMSKSFTWLKTWPEQQLSDEQFSYFLNLIQRRLNGEPIAYLTGERHFWTLNLSTNSSTLIPRPETELLVEMALEFLPRQYAGKVLDLGTGTGAIALAIASERPQAQVIGCDYNIEAVKLAQSNAKKNAIENVRFLQSNWFNQIERAQFGLIVANPPYIDPNDPHLSQGDLVFEPKSALVANQQGLADLKSIIAQAKGFLLPAGGLMLEHGYNQGQEVRQLMAASGYQQIKTHSDLAGLDRVSCGFLAPI